MERYISLAGEVMRHEHVLIASFSSHVDETDCTSECKKDSMHDIGSLKNMAFGDSQSFLSMNLT